MRCLLWARCWVPASSQKLQTDPTCPPPPATPGPVPTAPARPPSLLLPVQAHCPGGTGQAPHPMGCLWQQRAKGRRGRG